MAAWPGTLPAPIVNGWGLEPADHLARSSMESGADRVRRTSTARADKVGVQWVMTRVQFAAFRSWFESSTGANYGADWFTIGLQAGQDAGGACTTTETARFAGNWSAAPIDPFLIRVSGTLEVRDA